MPSESTPAPTLAHAEVLEQLPLLAGGGLTAAARLALENHLAQCSDCRQHWQAEQRLAALWQAEVLPQRSAEPALQQLLAQINRPASAAAPVRIAWWITLRTWLLESLSPMGLRTALAGVAALGLGLALISQTRLDTPAASPGYRVLSSDKSSSAARYDLQLVFVAGTSDSRREALLRSIDARQLGAANSVGALQLRPGKVNSDEALARTLAYLRAQPEVLLVGAVQPSATRLQSGEAP